jgi:hypothetical protein
MKFFYCIGCLTERRVEDRRKVGRRVVCARCVSAAAQFKRTGKCERGSPYGKAVGHKQDSWEAEIPVPDFILERHAESIAD